MPTVRPTARARHLSKVAGPPTPGPSLWWLLRRPRRRSRSPQRAHRCALDSLLLLLIVSPPPPPLGDARWVVDDPNAGQDTVGLPRTHPARSGWCQKSSERVESIRRCIGRGWILDEKLSAAETFSPGSASSTNAG